VIFIVISVMELFLVLKRNYLECCIYPFWKFVAYKQPFIFGSWVEGCLCDLCRESGGPIAYDSRWEPVYLTQFF